MLSLQERALEALKVMEQELAKSVPASLMEKPVEQLTGAEALSLAALLGSHQLVRIIKQPLDETDPKQMRLIGDMSHVAINLAQKQAHNERTEDALGTLLQAIQDEKLRGPGVPANVIEHEQGK